MHCSMNTGWDLNQGRLTFIFFLAGDSRSVVDIAFLHLHFKSAAEKQQGHISLSADC